MKELKQDRDEVSGTPGASDRKGWIAANQMAEIYSRALALAACLSLVACGGGGGNSEPVIGFGVGNGVADEIHPGNALLVTSIANRALERYLDYRELTSAIRNFALSNSPPIPASVPCEGTSGRLNVVTLSPSSFNVTPVQCRTFVGAVLNSGVIGITDFARSVTGSSVSFNSAPNAVQITDNGIDTVSGRINYHFSVITSGAGTALTNNDSHAGQLDFSRGGKTDQYRNLAASVVEVAAPSVPDLAVTVSRLEIATPRTPVSTLLVTTPAPVKVSASVAPIDGSLMAASSKDGSRAQFDYIGPASVRLRAWNSQGKPTLDVIKNKTDPDMIAAANAARN